MNFEDLAGRSAKWLDGSGPDSTCVVSTRVRLARNLSGFPFAHRAKEGQRRQILGAVVRSCKALSPGQEMTFYDASTLSELHRELLVERHLISPTLAEGRGPRGVLMDSNEVHSVMTNEEDHLRLQVVLSGFQSGKVWRAMERLERHLSGQLDYAFSERWGYLTVCPTNTGTGLRASILVHLPALALTQQMERVVRDVTRVGLTVRGLYGEGTEVSGNLFQLSNQLTLGCSEKKTLESLESVARQLLECEQNACEALMRDARVQIEDKVWRAYSILCHARMLTSQEFMNFSSAIRFGIELGLLPFKDIGALNALMVQTKPAHLQCRRGRRLDPLERDEIRAEMVRNRMMELGSDLRSSGP